jgi:hypothetical protein
VWKHGDFLNFFKKKGILKQGISHIVYFVELFLPNGKISSQKQNVYA